VLRLSFFSVVVLAARTRRTEDREWIALLLGLGRKPIIVSMIRARYEWGEERQLGDNEEGMCWRDIDWI